MLMSTTTTIDDERIVVVRDAHLSDRCFVRRRGGCLAAARLRRPFCTLLVYKYEWEKNNNIFFVESIKKKVLSLHKQKSLKKEPALIISAKSNPLTE